MEQISRIDASCRNLQLLARLFACDGPVVARENDPKQGPFVRVVASRDAVYPVRSYYSVPLEPVGLTFHVSPKRTARLNSFRYKDGAGLDMFVGFCADCGWHEFYSRDMLQVKRWTVCPLCKAHLSTLACPAWHAFGSCQFCTGTHREDPPFDAA